VNVDAADLVVKRGGNFADGADQTVSENTGAAGDITYVDEGASTGLNGKTAFTAAANTDTNGSLDFGILIPFDDIPTSGTSGLATTSTTGDQSYTFPDLLQVDNLDTGGAKDVVMQYAESIDTSTITAGVAGNTNGYVTSASEGAVDGTEAFDTTLVGENVNGGNDLSFDEVAHMFEFSVEDSDNSNAATRVSPPGDETTPGNGNQLPQNSFTIEANSSTSIDLTVNLTENLGDEIAGFVAVEDLDVDGGTVRLLDTIFVAEASGPTTDSVENITANTF
jgi:hypothetical protein